MKRATKHYVIRTKRERNRKCCFLQLPVIQEVRLVAELARTQSIASANLETSEFSSIGVCQMSDDKNHVS